MHMPWVGPVAFGILNTASAVAIVLANKVVLSVYGFHYPICLTWFHSIVTALGMAAMAACGLFQPKALPLSSTAPISLCYVCFIVFNNLSIKVNTVGFYQISKIAITPTVIALERTMYNKRLSGIQTMAVVVLLLGVAMATVQDSQVASNPLGMLVAAAAVFSSSLYQVWAGAKQKELQANGNQLLHQSMPLAAAILTVLTPMFEPVGWWSSSEKDSIMTYKYSAMFMAWMLTTCFLGLAVSLTAFLFIGASSALTYNIVGHSRTVLIVASGVYFFGDELGPAKLMGVVCAVVGIIWYTFAGLPGPETAEKGHKQPLLASKDAAV